MTAGPLFIMPSPAMLRAGAVWVTLKNWMRASREYWGGATVLTPAGILNDDAVNRATIQRTSPGGAHARGRSLRLAETAAKDARSWWRAVRFDRSVKASLPREPPMFVWQHHDVFQWSGFRVARSHGVPLVLFVDAPQVWEANQWGTTRPGWGRLVERFGETPQFREADLIACVSEEVGAAVIERGGNPERVVVTPCTADEIRGSSRDDSLRHRLGIDDRVVVGWVGSFRPFHHAEDIVESVARLDDPGQVALLLVGDGPTRQRCQQLAMDRGLDESVFPGAVSHDEIARFIHAMDVTLIPSGFSTDFHYSPLKLKEFMAAGRPVVAPAIGEMARALSNGDDALLYRPGDLSSLTQHLQVLVSDPALRKRLGEGAQETYDRLFSIHPQLELIERRLGLSL